MVREIETLDTKIVYENKWMKVREDAIQFPDGHEGIYGYIEKPSFSLIVPVHGDGTIQMVEQYRYPVGKRLWELPLGVWDENPGGDPADAAHAELAEETGLRAGTMEAFGDFFVAAGLVKQLCHMFLATDLTQGEASHEVEEQGMITRAFSIEAVLEMIQSGQISDTATIAALGYLRLLGRL